MSKQKTRGPAAEKARSNLRLFREQRRLTQEQLGERMALFGLGMSRATVSQIESGARRIDVDDLVSFARALGVSVEVLLGLGEVER